MWFLKTVPRARRTDRRKVSSTIHCVQSSIKSSWRNTSNSEGSTIHTVFVDESEKLTQGLNDTVFVDESEKLTEGLNERRMNDRTCLYKDSN